MKYLMTVVDVLIVVCSLAAAVYWFQSAKVRVPSYIHPNGSPSWKNSQSFRMIEQIGDAMMTQSGLSARGAIFAGIAAALSGVGPCLRAVGLI